MEFLKKERHDKWENLTKKLACKYEFFNCIYDYQKPVKELKREDFLSKSKYKRLNNQEKGRTEENFNLILTEIGEKLTKLYCQTDVILLADIFEKFIKVSIEKVGINP